MGQISEIAYVSATENVLPKAINTKPRDIDA
jgi:hypothetical protein